MIELDSQHDFSNKNLSRYTVTAQLGKQLPFDNHKFKNRNVVKNTVKLQTKPFDQVRPQLHEFEQMVERSKVYKAVNEHRSRSTLIGRSTQGQKLHKVKADGSQRVYLK